MAFTVSDVTLSLNGTRVDFVGGVNVEWTEPTFGLGEVFGTSPVAGSRVEFVTEAHDSGEPWPWLDNVELAIEVSGGEYRGVGNLTMYHNGATFTRDGLAFAANSNTWTGELRFRRSPSLQQRCEMAARALLDAGVHPALSVLWDRAQEVDAGDELVRLLGRQILRAGRKTEDVMADELRDESRMWRDG